MSQDADLDRWEISTAVIGLRGAYNRAMDAYRNLIPNQEIAGASVAEFVFWAGTLRNDEAITLTPSGSSRRGWAR